MRTPNPATLRLLQAGVSVTAVARRLGVTPQAVSFQLAGKAAETSTDLIAVIAELATPEAAAEVAELAAAARKAKAASA